MVPVALPDECSRKSEHWINQNDTLEGRLGPEREEDTHASVKFSRRQIQTEGFCFLFFFCLGERERNFSAPKDDGVRPGLRQQLGIVLEATLRLRIMKVS